MLLNQLPLLFALLLLAVCSVNAQVTCGTNYCSGSDQYCCNRSCGICATNGQTCDQTFCFFEAFAVCFSGETTVVSQDEGPIAMADLQVGDRILTNSGTYGQVYAFGHRDETSPTTFLKISTETQSLEVSSKHLVFVNTNDDSTEPIAAEQIQVGDELQTVEGGAKVISIESIQRKGLYAPFTTEGTLLVDGVMASSYISLPEFEWLDVQKVSHLAVAPFRLWCTRVQKCENDNEEDIPVYAASLLKWFQWVRQQPKIFQEPMLVAYLLLCSGVYLVEYMLSSYLGMMVGFGVMFCLFRRVQKKKIALLE